MPIALGGFGIVVTTFESTVAFRIYGVIICDRQIREQGWDMQPIEGILDFELKSLLTVPVTSAKMRTNAKAAGKGRNVVPK